MATGSLADLPALSRWSGEFLAPDVEQAFLTEQWPRTARQLRIVSAIAALGYLSALSLNYLSFGTDTPYYVMGLLRVAVAALLVALIHSTYHTDRYPVASRILLVAAQMLLGVGEVVEYHYYQELSGSAQASGIPFILFAILVFYTAFPNRLILTAIASLSAGAFTLFYLWLGPHASPIAVANYFPTLLVVNGLGIVVVRGWNRLTRRNFNRQQQLQQEIDARKRAQEEAERANRAKSRFLAMINHELRTPLNGVLGGVQLLQETPLSPEQQGHAELIDRGGRQLSALIDEVLDLARIEARHLELTREDFDLAELLADVDTILRPQTAGRDLSLTVTLAEGVPHWLRGDPTRLRQVLLNLGGNALKFTERGVVAIHVALLERRGASTHLRFAVSDSGIGLTAEERQTIFQPFTQADDTIRRRYGGSGLGLAICRELVTAMGGTIDVESAKGQGSTFVFDLELPLGQQAAGAPAEPEPAPPSSRLLLVEDAAANRQIASALLERMGHRVVQAHSGAEGLRLAAEQDFDAILMDLHMPGMDGLEVTQRIRALPDGNRAAVPIIALSADAQQSAIAACHAAGMQGFIPKPLRREQLLRTLAQVLAPRDDSAYPHPPRLPETPDGNRTALIDARHLADIRSDLGEDRYRRIIETCCDALHTSLAATQLAIEAQDGARLAQEAHRLKGIAGNYGLLALSQQARNLELAASSRDIAQMKHLHGEMESLVSTSVARLRGNPVATA